MLLLIEVELEAHSEGAVPTNSGHGIYGLLFDQLRNTNPQCTMMAHSNDASKSFSLSPLYPLGKLPGDPVGTLKDGDRVAFRIGLLEDETAGRITAAINSVALAPLYIGEHAFHVSAIRVLRAISLEEIEPPYADIKHFSIYFRTLTRFTQNHDTLYPEPRLVVESLAHAWRRAGGKFHDEQTDFLERIINGLQISRYRLYSDILCTAQRQVLGFYGKCSYQVRSVLRSTEKENLAKMLQLLPFAGIGYETTIGMGQAQAQY